jgi:hypothetical protein
VLFLADFASMAVNPMNWLVVPFLVPAVIPLALLPSPVAALLTMFGGFLIAVFAAWSFAAMFSLVPGAGGIAHTFKAAFAAVMLGLVLANFDFHWDDGSITLLVFQHPTLLIGGGRGVLPALRPWCPSWWIARAGLGQGTTAMPLLAMAGAAAALGLFAFLSLLSYRAPADTARRTGMVGRRPPRHPRSGGILAVLFSQEISYLLGSPRTWLAALAALGCSVWLLLSPRPGIAIPVLGAIMGLALLFSYPSNVFGHDGPAMRRYALASVAWEKVFLAKNLAFLACTLPLLLTAASAGLRLGAGSGAALALSIVLVVLLALIWGNLSSILAPAAGEPHALFLNQLFPLAVWGVPLLIDRSGAYAAVSAGCILLSMTVYALIMRRIAARFGSEVEDVLERF